MQAGMELGKLTDVLTTEQEATGRNACMLMGRAVGYGILEWLHSLGAIELAGSQGEEARFRVYKNVGDLDGTVYTAQELLDMYWEANF